MDQNIRVSLKPLYSLLKMSVCNLIFTLVLDSRNVDLDCINESL